MHPQSHRRFIPAWGLLLLAGAGALEAQPALRWSETQRTLTADRTKSEIATTFSFRNAGNETITILELTPTCGCTLARLEKKVFASGERGEITVVVTYGPDRDQVEESVMVYSNEPNRDPQKLQVKVMIPGEPRVFERIVVRPTSLEWARDRPAEPKIVTLTVRPNDAIRPVAIQSDNPAFRVALRAPADGRPGVFEAIITPLEPNVAATAAVTIATNSEEFHPEWLNAPPLTYRIVASVR
jgi:hypothetical protein